MSDKSLGKPLTMTEQQEAVIRHESDDDRDTAQAHRSLLLAEVDALRAAIADERKHADFGSRVFELFWCDGEPGDLDGGEIQAMAIESGLLRRVDASDGPGPHCEWCEDESGAGVECSCLMPTMARRAKEAAE